MIDASMVNFSSLFIFIMKTPMNNFGVQNFIHPEIILSRLAACKGLHFTSIQASLLISRSHPLEILDSLSLYLQWNLIVSLLLICQQMFTYSQMWLFCLFIFWSIRWRQSLVRFLRRIISKKQSISPYAGLNWPFTVLFTILFYKNTRF